MAKPNYSFEKRQRELAKKRKKEDKLAEKAARKAGGGPGQSGVDEPAPDTAAPDEAGGADAPAPAPAGGSPA